MLSEEIEEERQRLTIKTHFSATFDPETSGGISWSPRRHSRAMSRDWKLSLNFIHKNPKGRGKNLSRSLTEGNRCVHTTFVQDPQSIRGLGIRSNCMAKG